MREGWETAHLGEVCEIYQPRTISKKEMREDGQYPVFGANGIIGRYDRYNHEEPELLITCRGATCGSVNTSLPKSWITGNAMVVRPLNSNLDRRFLEFLFRGAVDFSSVISGSAQPQITRKSLSPVQIPLPPLPEQRRIVAILDEAFQGIDRAVANTEKNLANARELFESQLNAVFSANDGQASKLNNAIVAQGDAVREGWPEAKLGDVCKTGAGGTPLKSVKEYYDGGTIPWLLSGEVSQGEIHGATKFITKKGLENSSAKLFPPNSVLVAMYGATAGQLGILRIEATTNQAVCAILPNPKLLPEFIYYALLSKQSELISTAVGNAQPNISQVKVKNTTIPIPPLPEQKRIVAILDELKANSTGLVCAARRKLDLLAGLKQSILHKAFAGEPTADEPDRVLAEAGA